jgi:AcrR family transcriptional regulator
MSEEEKLRTDARANRDRILDVAREALAADENASMNSIAKLAGVGAGTLYRHFPSREALALGVYRKEIDALVQLSGTVLLDKPPLPAFRLWCDRLIQLGRVKQGIATSLHSAMSTKDFDETLAAMVGAVGRLMQACESVGDIRQGINPADVLVMLSSLWRLPPTHEGQAQTRRVLDLIFRAVEAKSA